MGKLPVTHNLTALMVDCVTTKKSKYVVRYAVLAYCSKYYKYLKGFVSLSYSNAAWLTNSKCGIRYAPEENLKYLIRLLFLRQFKV